MDLAWEMLPRLTAFRSLYGGTAGQLKPDALYGLAVAAGLSEAEAEALRDAREDALTEAAVSTAEPS